ncbi:hypothetical protein FB45DRAFT_1065076 [Roridomyces roridus]|uniref:Uncharacterized protein n=1 Tax=Roridomyces roridus TaxID=1738132 RepID=A0AAD7B8R4_9AGAR|nr:hypothetical protein FB45DRAFT_1065076 [Roridomyces roridus]
MLFNKLCAMLALSTFVAAIPHPVYKIRDDGNDGNVVVINGVTVTPGSTADTGGNVVVFGGSTVAGGPTLPLVPGKVQPTPTPESSVGSTIATPGPAEPTSSSPSSSQPAVSAVPPAGTAGLPVASASPSSSTKTSVGEWVLLQLSLVFKKKLD